MKIETEYQRWLNPELNQPRHVVWIMPDGVSDYMLLQKLNAAIRSNKEVIAGFTGFNNDTLIIQFPFRVVKEEPKTEMYEAAHIRAKELTAKLHAL